MDILGRNVMTIVDEKQMPGIYEINFDGSNLSSGIYYYRMIADEYIEIRKMVILK